MIEGLDFYNTIGIVTPDIQNQYDYLKQAIPNLEEALSKFMAGEYYGNAKMSCQGLNMIMSIIDMDHMILMEEFLYANNHNLFLEGWTDTDVSKSDMIEFFEFKKMEMCVQDKYTQISKILDIFDLSSF